MPSLKETAFVVLDTETTGADPTKDKPIELAFVVVQNFEISEPQSWFINPGVPIPPEASAVHHLVDEDVADAPPMEELWPQVAPLIGDKVIVAHNAAFDLSMLPQLSSNKSLCTLRLARQLWEKGERNERGFPLANHQQQVLRYWLGLKIDTMGLAAHRAAADILVTAQLLLRQMRLYLECGGEDDLDSLIEFSTRPIEVKSLHFGKHAGKPLELVPSDYLEYLLDKDKEKPLGDDLRASIKRSLDQRKAVAVIASRNPAPTAAQP